MAVRHMPGLDGLRGIAVLMVVFSHAAQGRRGALAIYQDIAQIPDTWQLPGWLQSIAAGASHGVQLFFVVSAFTLTLSLVGTEFDPIGYARRRLARVGPGYWLSGLVYLALAGGGARLWAPQGVSPADVAVAALFGSAWQGGGSLAVVPGGWSVCCEVAFYVALPAVLWVTGGQARAAAGLTAFAVVLAVAWFLLGFQDSPFKPVPQAPIFLCGVTAALMSRGLWQLGARITPLPALAFAVLLLPLTPAGQGYWGQLAFAALCAGVVAAAACQPRSLLASTPLRMLGRVSYSMYLVHFALLDLCLRAALWLVPDADWRSLLVHFSLTALATFGVACLTYRVVERPAVAWASRSRLRPVPAVAGL